MGGRTYTHCHSRKRGIAPPVKGLYAPLAHSNLYLVEFFTHKLALAAYIAPEGLTTVWLNWFRRRSAKPLHPFAGMRVQIPSPSLHKKSNTPNQSRLGVSLCHACWVTAKSPACNASPGDIIALGLSMPCCPSEPRGEPLAPGRAQGLQVPRSRRPGGFQLVPAHPETWLPGGEPSLPHLPAQRWGQ